MNTGIFLAIATTSTVAMVTVSSEEFDLLSRLVDFGMTGIVVYFGGKELVKAINGVGGRIDRLSDRISELHTDVSKLEVFLYGLARQKSLAHNYIDDESEEP